MPKLNLLYRNMPAKGLEFVGKPFHNYFAQRRGGAEEGLRDEGLSNVLKIALQVT